MGPRGLGKFALKSFQAGMEKKAAAKQVKKDIAGHVAKVAAKKAMNKAEVKPVQKALSTCCYC